MHYTGFFRRFLAYIIDAIITYVPFLVMPRTDLTDLAYFGVWTLYIVWMHGAYGATVGKMIMKIKVVKEDGSKINYQDSLLREITSYLSFVVFGLGYLNIIWNKKKQSWHDIVAKTVVIKV